MATEQAGYTERIAGALRRYFAEHPENIVCAYLYGSVARGEARPSSDIDVGVVLERVPEGLDGLGLDLASDLSHALGREVQVVVLNRAPVDLIHRVLRDGILVAEHDPAARVRFEVKKRNEYFDLAPILREYRRMKTGEP